MRNPFLLLAVAALYLCGCNGYESANPLDVKFGDPYVLLASDGHYYMYGPKQYLQYSLP